MNVVPIIFTQNRVKEKAEKGGKFSCLLATLSVAYDVPADLLVGCRGGRYARSHPTPYLRRLVLSACDASHIGMALNGLFCAVLRD